MGWHSYHVFYHDQEKWDRLIVEMFHELNRKWEKRPFPPFFFIRYWEGGPHLRWRFRDLDKEQQRDVLETVESFFVAHPSTVMVSKDEYYKQYQVLTDKSRELDWHPNQTIAQMEYQPEVERYNGEKMMALSEVQFEFSSRYVIKLLSTNSVSLQQKYNIGMQSIAYMVKSLGLNCQQEIDFLRSYCLSTLQTYQPQSVEAALYQFEEILVKNSAVMQEVVRYYWSEQADNSFYRQYQAFAGEVAEAVERGEFVPNGVKIPSIVEWDDKATALGQLYWSWIHMHCNRWGISPIMEAQITFLLSRSLKEWGNQG
ncbi:thiopeptide-type bacteriocin biosynthesis protein [Effusibacillus consociatus]|uniref:Thiopeptide-type bacteriocin biosynthesis protein n=1 Tax=Effusibacillus consociatus TaxID=1117041 RepID=A0ABV9PZI1_9BACL